ncbi:ROK family protein [Collinsella tanakaei]|uniref:ROK family protein n=1 Tax=Collinsella tanakaei TaxID=626935 RepID=UPI0025A38AD1|nr:ROK family protein [Collinsella tanakaei]MDM8300686.1 ROK family protein [Collinsella tanakaei]
MAEELFVGIDVGGTTVKEGLVNRNGEVLSKLSVPTPPLIDEAGYAAVIDGIKSLLDAQDGDVVLKGIGLAVPCPVPDDGNVKLIANASLDLPGLGAALKAAFEGAAVTFVNDANAAALGEMWRGSALGHRSMALVTLGTGIGAGVVIDGKVIGGANGAGGEVGHTCVNPAEERVCGCGRRGCLEQYASATGVVNSYKMECEKRGTQPVELSGPSDSKSVFGAYQAGDEAAAAAVDTMVEYLGLALANLACTVDPEAIVLGGGLSAAGDLFLDKLVERFKYYTLSVCADTPIEIASLGNDAGLIGAAYAGLMEA